MYIKPRTTRFVAFATAGILASSALLSATPAHADSSKSWKTGALGLGALGAYWLSQGKTLEGAAAVAGGYYAYKKGRDEQREEHNDDWRWDRRGRNDRNDYPRYGGGYGGGYYNGGYNGGYRDNDRRDNDRRDNDRRDRNGSRYDFRPYR